MAIYDITLKQGETWAKVLTLKDDSDVVIDVSADTFRGHIRKHHTSTDTQAEFTMTKTDGTNGVVSWTLSATDSAACSTGNLVYDLEWQKADGTVTRILEGICEISPEVTK